MKNHYLPPILFSLERVLMNKKNKEVFIFSTDANSRAGQRHPYCGGSEDNDKGRLAMSCTGQARPFTPALENVASYFLMCNLAYKIKPASELNVFVDSSPLLFIK